MELKANFILVSKNWKPMHFFFLTHILHEFFGDSLYKVKKCRSQFSQITLTARLFITEAATLLFFFFKFLYLKGRITDSKDRKEALPPIGSLLKWQQCQVRPG